MTPSAPLTWLPLALIALVLLTSAVAIGETEVQATRQQAADTAALQAAVQQLADQPAGGATRATDYPDAVRVGPALVPVLVSVRAVRSGTPGGSAHRIVRATGPGGVPVVAAATVVR